MDKTVEEFYIGGDPPTGDFENPSNVLNVISIQI